MTQPPKTALENKRANDNGKRGPCDMIVYMQQCRQQCRQESVQKYNFVHVTHSGRTQHISRLSHISAGCRHLFHSPTISHLANANDIRNCCVPSNKHTFISNKYSDLYDRSEYTIVARAFIEHGCYWMNKWSCSFVYVVVVVNYVALCDYDSATLELVNCIDKLCWPSSFAHRFYSPSPIRLSSRGP